MEVDWLVLEVDSCLGSVLAVVLRGRVWLELRAGPGWTWDMALVFTPTLMTLSTHRDCVWGRETHKEHRNIQNTSCTFIQFADAFVAI